MSLVPEELRYSESHEWVRVEDDGTLTVGITDHAQQLLGDLVYVELPVVGKVVQANEELAVVESVKAASDVYSPVGGEVVAVNAVLADAPELLNRDPYGDGWLFRLRPQDPSELSALMASDDYQSLLETEAE
jgi:glycine cleavage system H protein